MKVLTQEWLRASHDDLEVIGEILDREDLAHIVAFHAEQAVEKIFRDAREFYQFAQDIYTTICTSLECAGAEEASHAI